MLQSAVEVVSEPAITARLASEEIVAGRGASPAPSSLL